MHHGEEYTIKPQLSKKRILLTIFIFIVAGLVFALVLYVLNSNKKESKDQNTTNTSNTEEKNNKVAEIPKLTETPDRFMGKKACDLFSQTLADTLVGQGATRTEPAMFQKDFATISSCKYVKDNNETTANVYKYFNEENAKKYLDSVKKESFIAEQKKEFVVSVDFKVSGQRSEVKSKELMSEIVKKL